VRARRACEGPLDPRNTGTPADSQEVFEIRASLALRQAQTRAVLAKAEAGEADLSLDDLAQLGETEWDVVDLLAVLENSEAKH
jgi:hypothetical protein